MEEQDFDQCTALVRRKEVTETEEYLHTMTFRLFHRSSSVLLELVDRRPALTRAISARGSGSHSSTSLEERAITRHKVVLLMN